MAQVSKVSARGGLALSPHRLVLVQIIMARECKVTPSFVEAKKQRGLSLFIWQPLPPNPPNYESISGLIHRGDSSREPVASPLKTWVLETELPTHVTLRDI